MISGKETLQYPATEETAQKADNSVETSEKVAAKATPVAQRAQTRDTMSKKNS